MPCAAGDSSTRPGNTPETTRDIDHKCRGSSGDYLHASCGTQDPDSKENQDRVCQSCATEKTASKRKAGAHDPIASLLKASEKTRKVCNASTRVRLTLDDKLRMIAEAQKGTPHASIAKTFNCGVRTVSRAVHERDKLHKERDVSNRRGSAKSICGVKYPEVEAAVLAYFEETRRQGIPVNRASLVSFAMKAKSIALESDALTAEARSRLKSFIGGRKWVRGFLERNDLKSVIVQGETPVIVIPKVETPGRREVDQDSKLNIAKPPRDKPQECSTRESA